MTSEFQRFLTDARVRAADTITNQIICDGRLTDSDGEVPDPADVHEDVREALCPLFEEIRFRVEGPECQERIEIGLNVAAKCQLLAGHDGECEPCVGRARAS